MSGREGDGWCCGTYLTLGMLGASAGLHMGTWDEAFMTGVWVSSLDLMGRSYTTDGILGVEESSFAVRYT